MAKEELIYKNNYKLKKQQNFIYEKRILHKKNITREGIN